MENECEIDRENIYNIIQNKIELNIKKIKQDYLKYCINDSNINSNDIKDINEYIINYYRLNNQMLYLIKFMYDKFLMLEKYENINIISNMNILTNFNKKEFSFLFDNNNENDNNYKNLEHENIVHFNQKLKNYIYNDTIINLEEGLINFQLYNNFVLLKKEQVKDILIINDYDYLILTNINLLYFNTNENTMYKIVPNYIFKRLNFDIIKQYDIKKNSFTPINFQNKNYKNGINVIINYNNSPNELNNTKTDYNINKRLSVDISINNIDIDKINNASEQKRYSLTKTTSLLLPSSIVLNHNITCISKFFKNQVLLCYNTDIIKCTFSKINNELLAVKIFEIIPAHKKSIYLINILNSGNIITASEDETFKIWNIATSNTTHIKNKCLYTINKKIFSHYETINNNNINNDKKETNFICFGHKNGFFLCKNEKFNNLKNIINHEDIVTSILINNNNDIITGSLDGYIKKTNINNFQEDKKLFMEKGIISFHDINEYIFGVIIKDIGLFVIHSFELNKISYFKNYEDIINSFGNLGNGFFYVMIGKENDINSNNQKININSNNNIYILKVTMGKNGKYIVFS